MKYHMINHEVDALRRKLEQGAALTPYECKFLLQLLPACETRSRGGRKADPDLPVLHEAIAMLFALYMASGMTPKAARDKITERCGAKRSQIYTICQKHSLKPNIAAVFLPDLIKMLERAVDVKSPYSYPSWDNVRDEPATPEISTRDRSVISAAAVLLLIEKIAETRATGWRNLMALLPEESK